MLLLEQETIVRFDEEKDQAELYTASPRVNRLLTVRGLMPYKTDYTAKHEPCGWFYSLPKAAVIIKPGNHAIRLGGKRKAGINVPESALDALSAGVDSRDCMSGRVTVG